MLVRNSRQNAHIAGGVHVGKDLDVGVNDHEILFCYGCDETEDDINADSLVDDLHSVVSSVDSKGLDCMDCEVFARIDKELNIASGVHIGKKDFDEGTGDQEIMVGCASNETENAL